MKYPKVMSEWDTVTAAVDGYSLARFGDGELRLCLGEGKHIAQDQDKELSAELKHILRDNNVPGLLACIPNAEAPNGKPVMWGSTRYSAPKYVELYRPEMIYGSSFLCRPDSAPWIDTSDYWLLCRKLWEDKHVVLVLGDRGGSLTDLHHARSVTKIYGPERSAYAFADGLEEKIKTEVNTPHMKGGSSYQPKTVLLCLGPAATVLAYRLARVGIHAVDVGHLGRFMPQRFQHK